MYSTDKSRLVRATRFFALATLCAAGAAHAQLVPLIAPPLAPADLTPAAGVYPTKVLKNLPFVPAWTQFFPSGGGLVLNPLATNFVICLDPFVGGAAPAACTLSSADYVEAVPAPGTTSGTLTRVGNRFTFNPGRYLAASELNQMFRFTVGACSQLVERSCRYTSADFAYSNINPIAKGTGTRNTGDPVHWTLDVRANNSGAGAVPAFAGTVEYWEVIPTGMLGVDCLRNVDDPMLRNDMTLVAIDVNGTQTFVPSLPRPGGSYSGPSIQGIYRMGSAYDSRTFTTTSDPSLPPNLSSSRAVGEVEFPIPEAGLQRTFVVMSRLDTDQQLIEISETDNTWAQCKLR